MGGKSSSQTIGYRYYLGLHMALCHGPVDALLRIRVDGKVAWLGKTPSGRVDVDAPNLFGGKKREGGVSGALDFEPGAPDQMQNDYLLSKLGALVPAFRGVCCAVLRQMYVGMNPYLKNWDFRVQRIHVRQDGIAQWYPAHAPIPSHIEEGLSLCICIDQSGSMLAEISPGVTRMEVQVAETASAIRALAGALASSGGSIGIVGYGLLDEADQPMPQTFTRYQVGMSDVEDAAQFVESLYAQVHSDTDWAVGMAGARAFFEQAPPSYHRDIIFLTDGVPNRTGATRPQVVADTVAERDAIGAVNVYGIIIDVTDPSYMSAVDNTPEDGVPHVNSAESFVIEQAILNALAAITVYDMNPAHIIRECITDPDWGMGYAEADIDDQSFMAAADTLFYEGAGLSLLWDQSTPIEDFVAEVLRHIDGALYVDRRTGLWVLRLIRDDYIVEDLPLLDEATVERIENFSRPAFGELVNQVTVRYWDSEKGDTASVTVTDDALVQMQGQVVGQSITYDGLTYAMLATRVAQRDLKAVSLPLASGTVYTHRAVGEVMAIGDAFRLSWPAYDDRELILRVTSIGYGDGVDGRVRIGFTEDVFALPTAAVVTPPATEWTDPVSAPEPAEHRVLVEAPYHELVQRQGQKEVDDRIAYAPDLGYVLAAAARPSPDAINALLLTDAGAGYTERGTVDWSPVAWLAADLPREPGPSTIDIEPGADLDDVVLGTHAQIGDELVRVDAITDTTITLGRGCLDTVPAAHPAGAVILAWDAYAAGDDVEYAAGETVNAELLTVTGAGTLAEGDAPADSLTLDYRAQRPYPPGDLKVNGTAYPETIGGTALLSLSWVHRDRIQQTGGEIIDTTAGDIGPEAGTTYTLRLYGETDTLLRTETGISGTVYDYSDTDETADSGFAGGSLPTPGYNDIELQLDFDGSDGSTTITDSSSHDRSLTAWGNAQLDTETPYSGIAALMLDGSGDYVTENSQVGEWTWLHDGTTTYTVEGFLRPVSTGTTRVVLDTGGIATANRGLGIWISNAGALTAAIARGTTGSYAARIDSPDGAIPNDVWTNFAACVDSAGQTLELFVDGVSVGTAPISSPSSADEFYPPNIGRYAYGNTLFFSGHMDALRIATNFLYTENYDPYSSGGGPRLNGQLRVELESVRDGLASYQHYDITVLREGYGYNYGKLYGGA